jgi:hypothetical protein
VKRLFLIVLVLTGCSSKLSGKLLTRSDKATKADAYQLIAYRNERFIFKHKGRTITAKCVHTLSWVNNPNGDGEPMTEPGDCTYVTPLHIGDYYGEDLMIDYGTELRFCPWLGEKTTQTADILKVISEE